MNRYTYMYRNICLYKVGLTEIIELTVFCNIFKIYKYIYDDGDDIREENNNKIIVI